MIARIDSVATHALARPSGLACVDLESGRRWTYRELSGDVDRAAAWLVSHLGADSGRRIVVIGKNSATLLILHLAAARAGAVYVPLNWRLAVAELVVLVQDAAPSLVICDADFSLPSSAVPTMTTREFGELLSQLPLPDPVRTQRSADEASTLLYTSGTSGRPKGVIVTENNAFWGCTNFVFGNDVTIRSVFLCDMPMFHTAGLFAAIRAPLLAGASVLISRGFDASKTLDRIADRSLAVTHYFSVPQMAQALWQLPGFDPAKLRALTVYAMGGAPNPAAQVERFVRAGIKMSDGFGMSESGSNFGMPVHDADLLIAKAGSCGLPYVSLRARIVDEAGNDCPAGAAGELWLKGPSVTPGYWNKPQMTEDAFVDGWFKTGDAAKRDRDGFYYLIDRKKDMYISGGENVYPAEVEAILIEREEVAEAAIVGVPNPQWGEVGIAYIVRAPGRTLSVEDVMAHCRARLARFKAPFAVIFVDHIPRTSSGKTQKNVLKERALHDL